jgi:hypothetical protein
MHRGGKWSNSSWRNVTARGGVEEENLRKKDDQIEGQLINT